MEILVGVSVSTIGIGVIMAGPRYDLKLPYRRFRGELGQAGERVDAGE